MPAIARFAAVLALSAFVANPTRADAQGQATAPQPAICLPPGAGPVPCPPSRAGQPVRLQLATTSLPSGPIHLRFREIGTSGEQREASVTVSPDLSRDGGYEVVVPGNLCRPGQSGGTFAVDQVQSAGSGTAVRALGSLTVGC